MHNAETMSINAVDELAARGSCAGSVRSMSIFYCNYCTSPVLTSMYTCLPQSLVTLGLPIPTFVNVGMCAPQQQQLVDPKCNGLPASPCPMDMHGLSSA